MSNKIFHFLILAYATIFAQGCSFLEDFIDDEEHNETIETEYKLSTSDINGYDQMIYSDRVCHLYKANDNNLPHSITSFITDENNELHIIHYSFDDNGIPNYIIFDNQSIYLDNINGTTYDMTVINPDGTFFTLDNIDTGIDIASYWDNISTLTKAEPGMSYPEYAFALTKHLIGGVTMAQGGVMMLMGCAMLVPGANVAVGATLMLTGGAQFLAGALLTTRATDQIVSDGSHTEGFDQMASGLSLSSAMGGLTTAGSKISSEICKFIRTAVLEAGYDGTERFLREHRAECDESKEKVKDFLKEALITGDVNFLNLDSREVELSGSMTRLLSSSDRVGILLSSDTNAMYVDDYKDIDNFTSGNFKVTFSDLWRDQYYYRAFYESKEYNRTFIASAKSFIFPRVETLHYDILDDNKYKIHYRVDADPAHFPTETGICLSDTEYEPTIDDISKSITISESCEESIEFTLEEPFYYYRAYVKIGDKYIYGNTHELTRDERESLLKFYHTSNGPKWTTNTNWDSEKPIYEWYGVTANNWNYNERYSVNRLILPNNNVSGSPILYGLSNLRTAMLDNNSFETITVENCRAIDSLDISNNSMLKSVRLTSSRLRYVKTSNSMIESVYVNNCDFGFRDDTASFANLPTLREVEIKNSRVGDCLNFKNSNNLHNIKIDNSDIDYLDFTNSNINQCTVKSCYVWDIDFKNSNVKSLIISDCQNLDPGYSFDGLCGGTFDYILIENSMEHNGQSFFGGFDEAPLNVNNMEFKDIDNLGRIFFENVNATTISFYDCHFDSQGISISAESNASTLIVNNCTIPSGRIGGPNTTTHLSNSTIGDWWAADGYFYITNCRIEGFSITAAGSAEAIYEYLRKLKEGR